MVTDGNQKTYRARCLSDEGNFNFGFEVLHVGCDDTPERGSYFCTKHNQNEINLNYVEFDDEKCLK